VKTDGTISRQNLKGNLYLIGKGDTTLLKADLDKLAKKIKLKGITTIKGDLIGDDTWYDDIRLSNDLPWSDETAYYGAQISALTISPNKDYDTGSVMVEVRPGDTIGSKPDVLITPETDYVRISNQALTISPDGKKEIKIEREHATNLIAIEGALPLHSKQVTSFVSVWEPTRFVLDIFEQSLTEQGITLTGKIKTGAAPKTAEVFLSHQSMPLSKVLIPFMKLSNNGHAEMLIKEMGQALKGQGSWEKGLEVLTAELPNLGVNTETLVLKDGSGVSHVNLVPANEISNLLFTIQEEKWFPSFLTSLPVAGMNGKMAGGTLRKRLDTPPTKGKVRAKTGSISTVSSLSGYVETKAGKTLIFSILLNNLTDDEKGEEIEDKIVGILANSS
jgi:serine-type D-Ala-D-Ala carboxypeptidase/endopeptidase (penicillin-binding protein 4)